MAVVAWWVVHRWCDRDGLCVLLDPALSAVPRRSVHGRGAPQVPWPPAHVGSGAPRGALAVVLSDIRCLRPNPCPLRRDVFALSRQVQGARWIPGRRRLVAASSFRATLAACRPATNLSCATGTKRVRSSSSEALRVMSPDVLGFDLELRHFDLSLANRRATGNEVVRQAAAAMRETGLGLKAATVTPGGHGGCREPQPHPARRHRWVGDRAYGPPHSRCDAAGPRRAPHRGGAHGRRRRVRGGGGEDRRSGRVGGAAWRTERIDRNTCQSVAEFAFVTAAAMDGPSVYADPSGPSRRSTKEC